MQKIYILDNFCVKSLLKDNNVVIEKQNMNRIKNNEDNKISKVTKLHDAFLIEQFSINVFWVHSEHAWINNI